MKNDIVQILRVSVFANNYSLIAKSPVFAVENKSFLSLPNKKIFVLSAKFFGVAKVNAFWMSFMCSKKRSGPKKEPWRTLQPMTEVSEHTPLTDVNC